MRCEHCHAELDCLNTIEAVMDKEHHCPDCGATVGSEQIQSDAADLLKRWAPMLLVALIALVLIAFLVMRF